MLGAIGLGLVKGFTRNIKEEKLRRIADQEKVDKYEEAVFNLIANSANDPDSRMTEAAANALQGMVKNARGKLNEREAIDMFGTQSEALDIDFTSDMASILPLLKPVKEEEKDKKFTSFSYEYQDGKGNYLGLQRDPSKIDDKDDAVGFLKILQDSIIPRGKASGVFERSPDITNMVKENALMSIGILEQEAFRISQDKGLTGVQKYIPEPGVIAALDYLGQVYTPSTPKQILEKADVKVDVAFVAPTEKQMAQEGNELQTLVAFNFSDFDDGTNIAQNISETAKPKDMSEFLGNQQFGNPSLSLFVTPEHKGSLIQGQFELGSRVSKELMGMRPSMFANMGMLTGQPEQTEQFQRILNGVASGVTAAGGDNKNLEIKKVQLLVPYVDVPKGVGGTPAKTEVLSGAGAGSIVSNISAIPETRTVRGYYLQEIGIPEDQQSKYIQDRANLREKQTKALNQLILLRNERGNVGNIAVTRIATLFNYGRDMVMTGAGLIGFDTFENSVDAIEGNYFGGKLASNEPPSGYVTQDSLNNIINNQWKEAKQKNSKIDFAAFARYESLKIGVAFSLARAADPSGRLSNQDIIQQLARLDGTLDTQEMSLIKINSLIDEMKVSVDMMDSEDVLLRNTDNISDYDKYGARLVKAHLVNSQVNTVANQNFFERTGGRKKGYQNADTAASDSGYTFINENVGRYSGQFQNKIYTRTNSNGVPQKNDNGDVLYFMDLPSGSTISSPTPNADFSMYRLQEGQTPPAVNTTGLGSAAPRATVTANPAPVDPVVSTGLNYDDYELVGGTKDALIIRPTDGSANLDGTYRLVGDKYVPNQ